MGRYQEALSLLSNPGASMRLRPFRAMSHQALGQTKATREWLEKARQVRKPSLSTDLIIGYNVPSAHALIEPSLREAEAMIK